MPSQFIKSHAVIPINHWPGLGVTAEELETKSEWISRDHPRLTGATVMFFRTAGSLIRFSAHDFTLLPLAFFQAVVGLEKTLAATSGKNSESCWCEP